MTFYEINSIYGHDSFMIDVSNVGAAVKVRGTSGNWFINMYIF